MSKEFDFTSARERMVSDQLIPRGINDEHVLAAVRSVPRHHFIPADLHHLAYADAPLPIGHRQTISQPYIVALMTQLLELKGEERILEVGTGSGYQARFGAVKSFTEREQSILSGDGLSSYSGCYSSMVALRPRGLRH